MVVYRWGSQCDSFAACAWLLQPSTDVVVDAAFSKIVNRERPTGHCRLSEILADFCQITWHKTS